MNHLGSNYVRDSSGNREIFQDDILNCAANATNRICETLHIENNDWEKIYGKLIEVLNEVCNEPPYRNYN